MLAHRPADVVPALAEVAAAVAGGAWATGFLSYEAAPGLDPSLAVREPEPGDPPLVWFGVGARPREVRTVTAAGCAAEWRLDRTDAAHAAAVQQVRELIAAGQTYQVNLTDRLRAAPVDGAALYADLVLAQRCAYGALLHTGSHTIASASPELFLEWSGRRVRTRPMKGTARRGRTTEEDRSVAAALRSSPKERAENLMITDLLRNDLGRVAEAGSVSVDELFAVERYPTVWQLVSQVSATLREDVGLVELLSALFPCGSVTGAPKAAAMQAIAELETSPRGVYCGVIGWLAPPDEPVRARFSVAIRTAVVDATGHAGYGSGGGITWDSDPAAERRELRDKAAVLTVPHGDHRLLETLGHSPGGGFTDLLRHLARLADSAAYFGFRCDVDQVRLALDRAVEDRRTPTRVRLLLDREGRSQVTVDDPPPPPSGPVRLAIDDRPVDSGSLWLRHKTTRRDDYTAAAARHPDADDVVLVNERGEVTETTIATLCVRLAGTWWTPATASGCLPGTARARLLTEGVLRERLLTVADLHAAEEVAVVNSLRGWRPAVLLGRG